MKLIFLKNLDVHKEFIHTLYEEDTFQNFQYEELDNILLTDDDMYEIILDFLQQQKFDTTPLFLNLIASQEMYLIPSGIIEDTGWLVESSAISNFFLNRYSMVIRDNENKLELVRDITHEFGHIVDFDLIEKNPNIDCSGCYHNKSLLLEVNAFLYERQFFEYLIKNRMYPRYVSDMVTNYYESCFEDLGEATLTTFLPIKELEHEHYQKLDKKTFYEMVSKEAEILVDEEELPYPKNLSLYENIIYTYGRVLGVYFSYLKEHDKKEYQEKYKKFLDLRMDFFQADLLDQLGTNPDELKKILINDQKYVKQKTKNQK